MSDVRSQLRHSLPSVSLTITLAVAALAAWLPATAIAAEVGDKLVRTGDEIMVCGQLFHTTAPVVLWTDPKGYDAYRVERRFSEYESSSWEKSKLQNPGLDTPNRYNLRKDKLTKEQIEQVRGGGWTLPLLEQVVDQFVMHYDVCGVSQQCFKILHDHRGLSVHFMLDIDGTIYQTLDLKERAWHATISNTRSIGIEIASIGAYPRDNKAVLDRWYSHKAEGTILHPPRSLGHLGLRRDPFQGQPDRPEPVVGTIQGRELTQYDFTPQQYDSLIKLTATLCRIFPKLDCKYPTDEQGQLIPHKLTDEQWQDFGGVLGHYHVQLNKIDPGPAFNWEKVIGGASELLEKQVSKQ
ncbi:N-acetylmuramoyl-L-alanine amidase [Adhaeretor mobilis]|nr:peptidoglycan recognition family protein [Adhaeretor mobilis]